MRRIHVVTQKELVEEDKIKNNIAVVIDVLLATSTIVMALEKGISGVTPVKDSFSGHSIYKKDIVNNLLMGEKEGELIDGMLYPDPNLFNAEENEYKRFLILLTTNGTVAIENSLAAKELYVSSLLNGHSIAKEINSKTNEESIILVCAGNHGRFSLEDFIGAGQIIHHLMDSESGHKYSLSDSSKGALTMYRSAKEDEFNILRSVETSKMLQSKGFNEAVNIVINNIEKVNIVPRLDGKNIVKKY